jgi:hypothetical protein
VLNLGLVAAFPFTTYREPGGLRAAQAQYRLAVRQIAIS